MNKITEEGIVLGPDRRKLPMKADDFLRRIIEGERDFAYVSLKSGCSLAECDAYHEMNSCLASQDLSKSPIKAAGADFTGVIAPGLYMPHLEANCARFDYAVLTRSNLAHAKLHGAYFRGNAKLYYATLINADLSHAIISADMSNASLAFSMLTNANLEDAVFTNTDVFHADFSFAELRKAYRLEQALHIGTANFHMAKVSMEQKEMLDTMLKSGIEVVMETAVRAGPLKTA